MTPEDVVNKFRRTTTINDKKFNIKLLKASHGIAVAKKLANVIIPALGGGLDGYTHDEFIHGAPKTFSDLSLVLCNQIDKIGVENLIVTLLEGLEVEGRTVDLDEYFMANYGELIAVLEFALKENFASFFTQSGMKARLMKGVQMLLAQISQESNQE